MRSLPSSDRDVAQQPQTFFDGKEYILQATFQSK